MIDTRPTQYQDAAQIDESLRMDPEGKGPGDASRKVAGIGDDSSKPGYLDGQLLIAM
ncbi:MAG: hypothetical protein JO283_00030, partial [Bradyrhizobium sp.]|nr:hypothetical protein [Bradyrhizobium sp.]